VPLTQAPRFQDLPGIPLSLKADVSTFVERMQELDLRVRDSSIGEDEISSVVIESLSGLGRAMREHVDSTAPGHDEVGKFIARWTRPWAMKSEYCWRAFAKPRGYAGDAETIDLIYRNEPCGEGRLGPHIDRWVLELDSSRAVRNRRAFLSSSIAQLCKEAGSRPLAVTSLACGPARELFDALEEDGTGQIRATLFDIDPEVVASLKREIEARWLPARIRAERRNILRLARRSNGTGVEPQDLIYSLGLIDYLKPDQIVSMLDWIFDHLAADGLCIVGNFRTGQPDRPLMEVVTEWFLLHRTPDELKELFSQSKFGTSKVEVLSDPTGIQLYAMCRK